MYYDGLRECPRLVPGENVQIRGNSVVFRIRKATMQFCCDYDIPITLTIEHLPSGPMVQHHEAFATVNLTAPCFAANKGKYPYHGQVGHS